VPTRTGKGIRTSVILPEDAYARVQALAAANDVSTAWVIRHAILKLLDEHEGQAELPLRLAKARKQGER
jgi:predicted transcriptional regulator